MLPRKWLGTIHTTRWIDLLTCAINHWRMKRKEKFMKVRIFLSALLCSCMLMFSVIPASAADCSHVHWDKVTENGCVFLNSEEHEYYEKRIYTCVTCKEIVRTVRESKGTERHSRVTVADLGHVGSMSHKYRTQCTKCGYSVDVIVPCAGH